MTWIKKWPTGSAYIGADPDRGPQDIDFLGYVPEEHRDEQFNTLSARGWEVCGLGYSKQDDDKWCAFRKGDENLILCCVPLCTCGGWPSPGRPRPGRLSPRSRGTNCSRQVSKVTLGAHNTMFFSRALNLQP